MKNVLITGAKSYIGEAVRVYLLKYPEKYYVDIIDTVELKPTPNLFSRYDVVINTAGIAHIKETSENRHLYYEVNRDLSVKIAESAKAGGVKQFILISTMAVYGLTTGHITNTTVPNPVNAYGESKLQADVEILKMENDNFKFACLRPPMVYGKECKGNYITLSKMAKKLPVFPYVKNERSMLHIDNLCEFIRLLINNNESGIFYPQNSEYVNTSDMVRIIAEANNHKIIMIPCNWFIKVLGKIPGKIGSLANKAFGNLVYDMKMSEYKEDYRIVGLKEGIEKTESTSGSIVK